MSFNRKKSRVFAERRPLLSREQSHSIAMEIDFPRDETRVSSRWRYTFLTMKPGFAGQRHLSASKEKQPPLIINHIKQHLFKASIFVHRCKKWKSTPFSVLKAPLLIYRSFSIIINATSVIKHPLFAIFHHCLKGLAKQFLHTALTRWQSFLHQFLRNNFA